MQKQLVTVVIPVYKEVLTPDELISLKQSVSVLSKYPVTLVCPGSLNLDKYYDVYPDFRVEIFDDYFFISIEGYNNLLMSKKFYRRFSNFEFILIYQLDAFVFRDELEYWCNKNIDYIGAPWFEGFDHPEQNARFKGMGNGGFSLRKVKTHISILRFFYLFYPIKCLYEVHAEYKISKSGSFSKIVHLLKSYLSRFRFTRKIQNSNQIIMNEDGFWTIVVPKIYFCYKIADVENSIKFSFETNPEKLFLMNDKKLPFGCHAWNKYNLKFWQDFIK
jgi:hypothetical protein